VTLTEAVLEAPLALVATVTAVSAATVAAVAGNVAEELPAMTVTEAGTVRAALLTETETVRPPVAATLSRVTVQVVVALDATEVGLQANPLIWAGGAVTLTDVVLEIPLAAAATVTAVSAATVAAVAGNVAEELPAITVTEGGTVRSALLTETETVTPPEGATLLRATVQLVVAPNDIVAGEQLRVAGTVGATRAIEALTVVLLRMAVNTAALSAVTADMGTANVAVEAPASTAREAGTVTAVLLPERAMAAPPGGAVASKVAVQFAVPLPVNEEGVQVNEDSPTGAM